MGASKQKKKRLEEKQAGVESKWDLQVKEEKKAKKTKNKNIAVVSIILVISILVLFFSSNLFYRVTDAVKVGSVGYSACEYKFFYYDTYSKIYSNYYSSYGEYAQYFMPDEDTLKEYTFENMRQITMLYDEAKANNFEMPEDYEEYLNSNMESAESYATENGFPNVDGYLAAYYGKGMNTKIYKALIEKTYYASSYYTELYNKDVYTTEQLEAYYNEHSDEYDTFSYYAKFFSGAATEDDADTEEDETVTKEDAMASAKAQAEEYYVDAYETFKESDPTENQGMNISDSYNEWLAEEDRVEGDKTLIEVEDGYYVVCFVSRDKNEYNLVNIRHILISPEEVEKTDDMSDEDYEIAEANANTAAKAEAARILEEWQNGEATEASFGALATQYSDDSAEEGLYENVYKGQMVDPFEEWCFAEHQVGDTGIVETTYGYHIMYFVGEGESYHTYIAEQYKRSNEFNEWMEGKLETGYDLKQTAMFNFAIKTSD